MINLTSLLDRVKVIKDIDRATELLAEFIEIDNDIKRAIDFATVAHKGQFRKGGGPYITHPILVAAITAAITNDKVMVIAALLHDVVEDTPYTQEDITERFGSEVSLLVEGLTKIFEIREDELISSKSNKRLLKSALTFRKMLLISIKDLRVLVIKLCDRLHNMLSLKSLPPHKQQRIAQETLVVYVPIAHRLGISQIKIILEDLSFKYIYPDDYKFIDDFISSHKQDLNLRLNYTIDKVRTLLNQNGFKREDIKVSGRIKNYYSIYRKMHKKGVSIEEILDLLAIRILVKEKVECYKALGVLHLQYSPIISRFKDYIALPKDNGYKTIHTTLFFDESIIEAQIRTFDMHKVAELGVAAHWRYKEGLEEKDINLNWLNNLPYQELKVEEFYEAAKADLFIDDIVVYSPQGDKYTLPKGAIVLDFAYAVHTEVGHHAGSALVNKVPTSLLKPLKSGDIVKIITQDEPRLHCSWIDNVKTSRAKNAIKSLCNQRIKEINREVGLKILATIFDTSPQNIENILNRINAISNLHKVATSLDHLKDKINKIASFKRMSEVRFWELLKKGYKKPTLKNIENFQIYTNRAINDVEFDYCCHPKLGDDIVAFFENKNLVVHHKLCTKAYKLIKENDINMAFIKWNIKKSIKYSMLIALQNKKGALLELLKEFNRLDLNVTNITLGINQSEKAEYCKVEVETTSDNKNKIKDIISQKFRVVEFTSLEDAYKK